jgi:hypothetical protein
MSVQESIAVPGERHHHSRRWPWIALVPAALVLGVLWGFSEAHWFEPDWVPSETTRDTLGRLLRVVCMTAVCSGIAHSGRKPFRWLGSALMLVELFDVHARDVPESPLSFVAAALCVAALLASVTHRPRAAAWSLATCGVLLSLMVLHAPEPFFAEDTRGRVDAPRRYFASFLAVTYISPMGNVTERCREARALESRCMRGPVTPSYVASR